MDYRRSGSGQGRSLGVAGASIVSGSTPREFSAGSLDTGRAREENALINMDSPQRSQYYAPRKVLDMQLKVDMSKKEQGFPPMAPPMMKAAGGPGTPLSARDYSEKQRQGHMGAIMGGNGSYGEADMPPEARVGHFYQCQEAGREAMVQANPDMHGAHRTRAHQQHQGTWSLNYGEQEGPPPSFGKRPPQNTQQTGTSFYNGYQPKEGDIDEAAAAAAAMRRQDSEHKPPATTGTGGFLNGYQDQAGARGASGRRYLQPKQNPNDAGWYNGYQQPLNLPGQQLA